MNKTTLNQDIQMSNATERIFPDRKTVTQTTFPRTIFPFNHINVKLTLFINRFSFKRTVSR